MGIKKTKRPATVAVPTPHDFYIELDGKQYPRYLFSPSPTGNTAFVIGLESPRFICTVLITPDHAPAKRIADDIASPYFIAENGMLYTSFVAFEPGLTHRALKTRITTMMHHVDFILYHELPRRDGKHLTQRQQTYANKHLRRLAEGGLIGRYYSAHPVPQAPMDPEGRRQFMASRRYLRYMYGADFTKERTYAVQAWAPLLIADVPTDLGGGARTNRAMPSELGHSSILDDPIMYPGWSDQRLRAWHQGDADCMDLPPLRTTVPDNFYLEVKGNKFPRFMFATDPDHPTFTYGVSLEAPRFILVIGENPPPATIRRMQRKTPVYITNDRLLFFNCVPLQGGLTHVILEVRCRDMQAHFAISRVSGELSHMSERATPGQRTDKLWNLHAIASKTASGKYIPSAPVPEVPRTIDALFDTLDDRRCPVVLKSSDPVTGVDYAIGLLPPFIICPLKTPNTTRQGPLATDSRLQIENQVVFEDATEREVFALLIAMEAAMGDVEQDPAPATTPTH